MQNEANHTPAESAAGSGAPARQALPAPEMQDRLISEYTSDTIWTVDLATGRFTYVSPSVYRLRGYRPEEIIGQDMQDVLTPESYQFVIQNLPSYLAAFVAGDVDAGFGITEIDQYHKDGSIVHTEVATTLIPDEQGRPVTLLGVSRNITERKRAQQALQQRNRELSELNTIVASITSSLALEDVLQSILNALPHFFPDLYNAAVQLVDEFDGQLRTCIASENVSLSGKQMVFQPGQGIAGWVFQEHKPLNVFDVTCEPRYIVPSTTLYYRSLLAVPLIFKDQALGVLCITSQQAGAFDEQATALLEGLAGYAAIAVQNARLYEQTRRDANAKQTLLREVNHRVKNNLVSILALLNMEKHATLEDGSPKPARQLLNDLSERIRSLLVVHDQLSASQWSPLLAETLVRETVQSALAGSPVRDQIELYIDSPVPVPLWIAPNRATELALATNELATNSVKYAFAGREHGRIDIHLSTIAGTSDLCLLYHDDGPGWPDDVLQGERENTGLGLVRSAVRNHLALSNQSGAVARLIFTAILVPAQNGSLAV